MSQAFFQATVLARQALGPGMLRLTLGGAGLAAFGSTGIADEYLRLFFPDPATGRLHLPHIDADGRWSYPDGQAAVRCSTYTVRRFDSAHRQLDIDFVLHEGGTASDWAQRTRAGDTITLNQPRGLYAPPADARWQLLVADATGLPALARILEQTPPDRSSRVLVEVSSPEHEQALPFHPLATVTWLHGSGNGVAPSQLDGAVRNVPLPQTPGYIWAAGEQKAIRAIRKHVRHELKLASERYELVGYWIADGKTWDAGWAALPAAVKASIEAGWDSGRDREVVQDEYDAVLERFGL